MSWADEVRKGPSKGPTRGLLLGTLAWRLQEKVFGGHDRDILKPLDAYAHALDLVANNRFRNLT